MIIKSALLIALFSLPLASTAAEDDQTPVRSDVGGCPGRSNHNADEEPDAAGLMRDMYVLQAKKPGESKGDWDLLKVVGVVPGSEAFRPLAQSDCPLVHKTQ